MHASRVLIVLGSLASTLSVVFAAEAARTAPEGCRKLNSDSDWPSLSAWQAAIPGVEPKAANIKVGPDYRIRVKTATDVQKALKFANDNNIRVTIIASGHDFMGRSTAASGLLIDVSLLNGVRVAESYKASKEGVPDVAPGQKANVIVPKSGVQAAVTIGAGISTQALNNAISPSKLFTLGASHGSVSVAGGWGQLGGHAALSAQYGLGVDQWLEAKVVTADGRLLIANKVSNPDLFWAIRGGGGGTFGVVIEATIKAIPDTPITVVTFWINQTSMLFGKGATDATHYLLTEMPRLKELGVSGYFVPALGTIRGQAIHTRHSVDEANALWKPILEKMESFPGLTKFQSRPYAFKNYKHFYDIAYGAMDEGMGMAKAGQPTGGHAHGQAAKNPLPEQQQPQQPGGHAHGGTGAKYPDPGASAMGGHAHGQRRKLTRRHGPEEMGAPPNNRGLAPMDSHLLAEHHIKKANVMDAFKDLMGNYAILLVTPPKNMTGTDTSTLPAWRKAVVHVTGMRVPLVMNANSLRKFAPDMGAYGNEADYEEVDWQRNFWGENYSKLSQIKTKYDPSMTFWVTPGINAEQWQVRSGRVCKVKGNPPAVTSRSKAPATDNQSGSNWLMDRESVFGTMDLVEQFPAPGKLVGIQAKPLEQS